MRWQPILAGGWAPEAVGRGLGLVVQPLERQAKLIGAFTSICSLHLAAPLLHRRPLGISYAPGPRRAPHFVRA